MKDDRRILSLALEALYAERQKIEDEIAMLQGRLGQNSKPDGRSPREQRAGQQRPKGRISAAGLKAIAAAQRKRWAKARATKTK